MAVSPCKNDKQQITLTECSFQGDVVSDAMCQYQVEQLENPSCQMTMTYGRKKNEKTSSAYLQRILSLLDKKEDECDKFAGNVAAKLRIMNSHQSIYAEHLINKILYHGLLGELNEDSKINIKLTLSSDDAQSNWWWVKEAWYIYYTML